MTAGLIEISRQSWEYRLVAAVIYAVEQRAGRSEAGAQTRWNQQVLEEPDLGWLGQAHEDGSLSVSVAQVLEPLRRARDLDRELTEDEAQEIRDCMATLTHEATHLLADLGDPGAPDARWYDNAAEAVNEGRVEHWTHRNLDNIVGDVFPDAGLEHVQEAVLRQSNDDAYAAYTTAARRLDRALAKRSGLKPAEVTGRLICADDYQRWNVTVDMVIDNRLVEPGLMPEAHRAEKRDELIAPLRDSLTHLVDVEADESLSDKQKSAESLAAARTAIAEFDHELNRIERNYRVEGAQRAQQQAGQPGSRRAQAVRQAQEHLSPDLERLQQLTASQAPASGAPGGGVAREDPGESDQGNTSRPRPGHAARRYPASPGPQSQRGD